MKKRIARVLSALIVFALALGALPARAAEGITILRRGKDGVAGSLRAMAYYDSTLYVFTYGDTYYTWTREGGTLRAHPFDNSFERGVRGAYSELSCVLAGPDGLYALLIDYESADYGDGTRGSTFSRARLCRLAFAGDGAIGFEEGVELDWEDMLESYDYYEYARAVRFPFISENTLVFATDGDDGADNLLFACDIRTGAGRTIGIAAGDAAVHVEGLCAYGEGRALVASYGGTSGDEPVVLYAVDLETGAAEKAMELPAKNYNMPGTLLYDPAGDALYYTLAGELFKAPGLDAEKTVSVAAAPVDARSDMAPALTADGLFICSDHDTVIARDTDPSARPSTRLTVSANGCRPLEDAYYAFANAHPDVDVVVATSYEDITRAMMNRSDAVDIYTAEVSGGEYAALFDRGYLADLSGSGTLTGLVSSMYPGIRDAVMKDGSLYALPVEIFSQCWSYNPKAAAELGLRDEDMPGSWMGLLRFLQTAQDLIGDSAVTVFDPNMTAEDARSSLLYAMLDDCMLYLKKAEGVGMAFDTPLLRALLAEYEKIDFARFGLSDAGGADGGAFMAMETGDGENGALFYFYGDVSVNSHMFREYALPMPLAIEDGRDPMVESRLTVSFVNPYSKNAELAVAYLEAAAGELSDRFLANACPGRDEPIRKPYYEDTRAYYEETIASLETELEKAGEDDREEWRAQLDEVRGDCADFERVGAWDATEESIAAYREYGPYIAVAAYFGLDSEAMGGFYDSIRQYLDGAIDANTMIQSIDRALGVTSGDGQ